MTAFFFFLVFFVLDFMSWPRSSWPRFLARSLNCIIDDQGRRGWRKPYIYIRAFISSALHSYMNLSSSPLHLGSTQHVM